MADPIYPREGVRVIRQNVDVAEIAEEYVIHELIKMFPGGDETLYDQIRYHVRKYRSHYRDDRFWRLISGLADAYMFKGLYRMLKGNEYRWVLAEVSLDNLHVKMLSKEVQEIMKSVDFNVKKAGEILRKMPGEERLKIIDPFDFSRDTYPVLLHEDEQGDLVLHDGNRRVVNAAIYDLPSIKAYVGLRNPQGKPALREDFVADYFKLIRYAPVIDKKYVNAFMQMAKELKRNFINGEKLVDDYIRPTIDFVKEATNAENKEAVLKVLHEALEYQPDVEDIQPVKAKVYTKSKNGDVAKAANLRTHSKALYS